MRLNISKEGLPVDILDVHALGLVRYMVVLNRVWFQI